MRDFDIYRWSYKEPEKRFGASSGMTYHCKSQIGIAFDGILHDTFWMGHGGKRGGNYGPAFHSATWLHPDQIETQFLGNLCDLEEIYPEDARDYPKGCVVDLRHSNNSNAPVLVPKGQSKSVTVMVENLQSDIVQLESNMRGIVYRIELKRAELAALLHNADREAS
jgi:hypothetical protein